MQPLICTIPMQLPSVANVSMCWQAKARMVKQQRASVALVLASTFGPQARPLRAGDVWRVKISRLSNGRGLDGDNLVRACKAVRDEIAAWIGLDDASAALRWTYTQGRSIRPTVVIELEMEAKQPNAETELAQVSCQVLRHESQNVQRKRAREGAFKPQGKAATETGRKTRQMRARPSRSEGE
jgi:hypothetical protein